MAQISNTMADDAVVAATLAEFDAIYRDQRLANKTITATDDAASSAGARPFSVESGTTMAASASLHPSAAGAATADLSQWTSSFTMEQIPRDQVMAWVKATADRIMLNCGGGNTASPSPPPLNVLDVGCGSGLLLFEMVQRLAGCVDDGSSSYVGLDLSPECIGLLKAQLAANKSSIASDSVRLIAGAAHDVEALVFSEEGDDTNNNANNNSKIDTVIMHGVVQHMPSVDYLKTVLAACVKNLQKTTADGTDTNNKNSTTKTIYCGDVRDSRLLRVFYHAIALSRECSSSSTGAKGLLDLESPAVRDRIDTSIANDPQLLVSPLDFIRFVAAYNSSSSSAVSLLLEPKLSSFAYDPSKSANAAADLCKNLDSEMNRFRFDATLFVEKATVSDGADEAICRIQIPVAEADGALLLDAANIVAFNAEPYLDLSSDAVTSTPREELSAIIEGIISSSSSSYGLFTYPNLAPFVDALAVEPLFSKEGRDASVAVTDKAVLAATIFDSPLQLSDWFVNETAFAEQWQLKLTLHPSDPLSLICIVAPKNAAVRVTYAVVADKEEEAKGVENLLVLKSSQPNSSPRQAHFSAIPDVVDRWVAAALQKMNATATEFPLRLGDASSAPSVSPIPMGAAMWKSMKIACGAMPNARAIYQPSIGDADASGADGISWSDLALWSHDLCEHLLSSECGVVPGAVVIQFVDRSFEQIAGMLAVFGIGAVFAPLAAAPNPDPPARIAKIFSDCKPTVVLTQPHLKSHMEEALALCPPEVSARIRIVCAVDIRKKDQSSDAAKKKALLEAALERRVGFWDNADGPAHHITVNDPSYSIYTSGSTGDPKAVVLVHTNFHYLVCAFHYGSPNTYSSSSASPHANGRIGSITRPVMRTLQTTAASFDLHVYECLAPLYHMLLSTSSSSSSADDDDEAEEKQPQAPAAELVLLPPMIGAMDLEHYATLIDHGAVTHVVCTPTMLASLAEYCSLANCWRMLRSVEVWRTGGEALKQSTVDAVLPRLREHNPTVELWCSYGPAECTDSATMSFCETTANIQQNAATPTTALAGGTVGGCVCTLPDTSVWTTPYVPVGRPLANYGIHVVVEAPNSNDDAGAAAVCTQYPRLARAGEAGMIYLSGPGVYKGYLGRDDLTNSVKKQMRISSGEEAITIYRTGDLGKYTYPVVAGAAATTSLAQFWHLGRADFSQVKLRGQRIETTEIETILMQHESVAHAIVAKYTPPATAGGEEFLVAYFSVRGGKPSADDDASASAAIDALRADLKALAERSFPSFMVPSSFTYVETFATNRNGKVDRKLLPLPDRSATGGALDAAHGGDAAAHDAEDLDGEDDMIPLVPCTDARLIWLRQQFLSHWLATVPCPDAEVFLSATTPDCTEPIFTSGWIEMGASSVTLMRFIGRLKIFVNQWVATLAVDNNNSNTANAKDSKDKKGNNRNAAPVVDLKAANAAFTMEAAVTTPRPQDARITSAMTPQQLKQAIDAMLTFPSVYKQRNMNTLTETLADLLFPAATAIAATAEDSKNGSIATKAGESTASTTTAAVAVAKKAKVVPIILYPATTPPEPTESAFRFKWSLILKAVKLKKRVSTGAALSWGVARLVAFDGPRMAVDKIGSKKEGAEEKKAPFLSLVSKLRDETGMPGSSQQSIFYLGEENRIGGEGLTMKGTDDSKKKKAAAAMPTLTAEEMAAEEDKQHHGVNCPYVVRITPSAGAARRGKANFTLLDDSASFASVASSSAAPPAAPLTMTLGEAQAIVAHLETITRDVLQQHPSVRVRLQWDEDHIVQRVYSLLEDDTVAASTGAVASPTVEKKSFFSRKRDTPAADAEGGDEKKEKKSFFSRNNDSNNDSSNNGAVVEEKRTLKSFFTKKNTTTTTELAGEEEKKKEKKSFFSRKNDSDATPAAAENGAAVEEKKTLKSFFTKKNVSNSNTTTAVSSEEKKKDDTIDVVKDLNPFCRYTPHYIFSSEEDAAASAAAYNSHFAFSPAAGDATVTRTPLLEAVQRAAREKICSTDKKCLFRFKAFYELPLSAKKEKQMEMEMDATTTAADDAKEKDGEGGSVADAAKQATTMAAPCPLDTPVLSLHVAFNFHHSVFDGHSMILLLREMVSMAHARSAVMSVVPAAAASASVEEEKEMTESASPAATATAITTTTTASKAAAPAVNYREDPFFKYCANVSTGQHLLAHKAEIYYWLRHMEGWRPATISKHMPKTITPEDGKWPSPDQRFFRGVGKVRTFLTAEQGDAVRRLCGARHWTPYSFFMACYYLVLAIAQKEKEGKSFPTVEEAAAAAAAAASSSADGSSGSEEEEPLDLCIGSPFSTRLHAPELQERICCFTDIYPFRVSNLKLAATKFDDFVDTVQEMSMMHMEHSKVDIGTIVIMMAVQQTVDAVTSARTPFANPLFAPAMLYEDSEYGQMHRDTTVGPGTRAVDLELLDAPDFGALVEVQLKVSELRPAFASAASFASSLSANNNNTNPNANNGGGHYNSITTTNNEGNDGNAFALTWEYASEVYDQPTIDRIAQHYKAMVDALLLSSEAIEEPQSPSASVGKRSALSSPMLGSKRQNSSAFAAAENNKNNNGVDIRSTLQQVCCLGAAATVNSKNTTTQ